MKTIVFEDPVSVETYNNPKRLRFKTASAFVKWADAEIDAWDIDASPVNRFNLSWIDSAWQLQRNHQSSLVNVTKDLRDSKLSLEEARNRITNVLASYREHKVLHSSSAAGQTVLRLLQSANQTDIERGSIALAYFTNQAFPYSELGNRNADLRIIIDSVVSAEIECRRFVRPMTDHRFETLWTEWSKRLDDLNERSTQWQVEAGELLETESNRLAEAHADFSKFREEAEEWIQGQEDRFRKEFFYKAPAEYWINKTKIHRLLGYSAVILFVIISLGLVVYVFLVGLPLLAELQELHTGEAASGTLAVQFLSRLILLALPAFLVVWFLRIVVKVTMANLALADDASERVTMVRTFRSLLDHEGSLTDADKLVMLQALFRPGALKGDNDAPPPNWFDILMNQVRTDRSPS